MLLGIGTALVAAGRLWLTHAEISGLAALALGAALTVLCLAAVPTVRDAHPVGTGEAKNAPVLGLLYLLSLAATVALGFLRAHTLGDMFWADIPLLLGAGTSVGMAVGSGWVRRSRSLMARLVPPCVAVLLVLTLLFSVTHIARLAGLVVLGAVLFALLERLSARTSPEDSALGALVGMVMIVSGATLAFALSFGYGLGLFVLGGWLVSGLFFPDVPAETEVSAPRFGAVGALSFTSLLLVYRLGLLQDNSGVRANGPGDTWDLFAICLGVLLPMLSAEWSWRDAVSSRRSAWAIALFWTLSLVLPAVILGALWQPRSVAGLLLGAALGQLLSGVVVDAQRRFAATALSGAVFGLVLFVFQPLLGNGSTPTRTLGLVLVTAGTVLVLVRLFLPGRQSASTVGESA
jgi:hypothetical protein